MPRRALLFGGKRVEQGVEVFEAGVLDDDAAAAVFVLNADLEAECALELVLGFLDVGVDFGLFRLFLFRLFAFGGNVVPT